MTVPVHYPQIRHFPQCSGFQPQPVVNGGQLLGAPYFHSQEEAAFFVLECFRLTGQPPPAFSVTHLADLDGLPADERQRRAGLREGVTEKAKAFLKTKGIEPAPDAPALAPEPAPAAQPPRGKKAEHPQPAR